MQRKIPEKRNKTGNNDDFCAMELGAGWLVSCGFEQFAPFMVFFFIYKLSSILLPIISFIWWMLYNKLIIPLDKAKNNLYCKNFHPKLHSAA